MQREREVFWMKHATVLCELERILMRTKELEDFIRNMQDCADADAACVPVDNVYTPQLLGLSSTRGDDYRPPKKRAKYDEETIVIYI